ncbi:hypothetical protein [uncultured Roseobacter sp.]|uniref:hypothetical protein n=1 Tax=uncultured Roseobacter sp. TaxID=114847 RepID=UPI0026328C75|nr:hypothetical protein [uncultured Roseobacter sp.]
MCGDLIACAGVAVSHPTVLNTASALGIGLLAVPAFSLNFNKKTLTRIEALVRSRRDQGDSSALDVIAQELEQDAAVRVASWRRADELCLRIGYGLLLGSAVLRIFAPAA